MSIKNHITSQKLVEKFKSPFDLVSYASKLAREISQHGEEHRNLANEVLEMILDGRDKIIGDEELEQEREEKEE